MDQLNVTELLTNPQAMIIPVLLFLGYLLKSTPLVPDKWIVWVLAGVGTVLGYFLVEPSVQGLLAGFLYASTTVTGHQAYKQLLKKE